MGARRTRDQKRTVGSNPLRSSNESVRTDGSLTTDTHRRSSSRALRTLPGTTNRTAGSNLLRSSNEALRTAGLIRQ